MIGIAHVLCSVFMSILHTNIHTTTKCSRLPYLPPTFTTMSADKGCHVAIASEIGEKFSTNSIIFTSSTFAVNIRT